MPKPRIAAQNPKGPLVSLIFPVLNEGSHVYRTIRSLRQAKSSLPIEIVVVDDGSTDGCCDFIRKAAAADGRMKLLTTPRLGIAGARNAGAEASSGSCFVFCDGHLFFRDRWLDLLLKPLLQGRADAACPAVGDADNPLRTGCGQTLDGSLRVRWNRKRRHSFPAPIVPGGCFAITRRAFEETGGFDGRFTGWGFEDVELSLRLWLFEFRCCVEPAAKVLHVFRRSFPYEVEKTAVYANMLRMAYCHFSEERIEACKKLIGEALAEELDAGNRGERHAADTSGNDADANACADAASIAGLALKEIEAGVIANGALEQREAYTLRRVYDDDWFMETFGIPF